MEPRPGIVDALEQERVARARAMPPEDKLLAGARLFDLSSRIMADGIRDQYPDADAERVAEILAARLARLRRLENAS